MSCNGNNATPPSPAIAPGADRIDPRQVALEVGRRGVDPRLAAVVPGVDAPFFQAGLAGYSDAAMRIVARRHGCPLCITEALLDRSLLGGGHGFDKADLGLLADNVPGGDEDHPLVGQIMGSDPDEMAAAAVKMIEQGRRPAREYRGGTALRAVTCREDGELTARRSRPPEVTARGSRPPEVTARRSRPPEVTARRAVPPRTFATIDVNLACPVKKIKAKARGGHWLRDPEGAIEILRAVRAAVPLEIPVTVKMRRGSDDSAEAEGNFRLIFEGAYEAGCAWVTVHGRTVEQKYVGPSRWTFLRDLVARYPDRLIFGSGDIWSVEEIFRMIGYTGVQAVSVARGCIGNPWIFRQARDMMAGREPAWPTIAEQREVLREHFELSVAVNGEERAGRMMRKFGIKFSRHHPRGEEVKMRMVRVSSVEDWRGVLEEFYTDQSRVREHAGAA